MLLEFIDNAKLLVNTLGYKVFETIDDTAGQTNTPEYFYITAARGANAKGLIVSDGFAVLKGAKIACSTVPSMPESLIKFRNSLIDKGIINENFEFTKDYISTSPSLAAAVVMGRSANGRTEWKNDEHKSIKDIEEA